MNLSSALPVQVGEVVLGKFRVDALLSRQRVQATRIAGGDKVDLRFGSPSDRSTFFRCGALAVQVRSAHAFRVVEYAQLQDGTPLLATEPVTGLALSDALRRGDRCSEAIAIAIGMQVCAALREAHAIELAHGGIDLTTLIDVSDGIPFVKLVDFAVFGGDSEFAEASAGDIAAVARVIDELLLFKPSAPLAVVLRRCGPGEWTLPIRTAERLDEALRALEFEFAESEPAATVSLKIVPPLRQVAVRRRVWWKNSGNHPRWILIFALVVICGATIGVVCAFVAERLI